MSHGLRAKYDIVMDWGVLTPRGRLEYTHDFSGSSQASMGYADMGTLPYILDLEQFSEDYVSIGVGADATFENGSTLSLDYRTSLGFDGDEQDHTFAIRFGINF